MVVADERYEALLAAQPDDRPDVAGRGPDDLYGLWTGGTTGMPKGVMWRHEDIYLSVVGGGGNPALGHRPGRRRSTTSPPGPAADYPIAGDTDAVPADARWRLVDRLLPPCCRAPTNVLIRDLGFDPEFALRVMAEEEVRVVMTIGDAYARPIVDHLEADGHRRPRPVQAARLRVRRRHPVAVAEGRRSAGCCPTSS